MSYTLLDSSTAPMVGTGKLVKLTEKDKREAKAARLRMEKKWGIKAKKYTY